MVHTDRLANIPKVKHPKLLASNKTTCKLSYLYFMGLAKLGRSINSLKSDDSAVCDHTSNFYPKSNTQLL